MRAMMRPMTSRPSSLSILLLLAGAPAALAQTAAPQDMVETCVPCHGRDGVAREAEVPHLAGQNEIYLFNQMKAFRSGARRHPEMRYITRHLDEAELAALAAYFAALPPR